MKVDWYILRFGNWKVTVTSLPASAAARRDYQTTRRTDYLTTD